MVSKYQDVIKSHKSTESDITILKRQGTQNSTTQKLTSIWGIVYRIDHPPKLYPL